MTTFLLDLWQDLRAKRLWPVAVALLAATVAVPALMFKPASSGPPASGSAQADDGAKLPSVALDASSVENSHLNVFSEKDPFAALKDNTGTGNLTGGGNGGGNTAGQSVSKAASGAGASSSSGPSDTGAGGTGTAPTGPDGNPVSPGLHYFTYTADLRFGPAGDVKTYKSVKELEVLPNGKNPIVSFMGVKNGKTAVFFIADPGFRADGEGKCQPSNDQCRFVYLKKDADHNEETLSAQGGQVQYTLILTDLHVKNLSESDAVGNTTPDKSPSGGSKRKGKVFPTLLNIPSLTAK
jgi:hypothetical protein